MGEGSLPVKQFLQNCSAVISREPKVFLEAVLATCSIKESGGRTMVILRKQKVSAAAPAVSAPLLQQFCQQVVIMFCDASQCGLCLLGNLLWSKSHS